MKGLLIVELVVVAMAAAAHAQQTCPCDIEPAAGGATCASLDSNLDGTCNSNTFACDKCVCSALGAFTCNIVDAVALVFTTGNQCETQEIKYVECPPLRAAIAPPKPPPAPIPQSLTVYCNFFSSSLGATYSCETDVTAFPRGITFLGVDATVAREDSVSVTIKGPPGYETGALQNSVRHRLEPALFTPDTTFFNAEWPDGFTIADCGLAECEQEIPAQSSKSSDSMTATALGIANAQEQYDAGDSIGFEYIVDSFPSPAEFGTWRVAVMAEISLTFTFM